MTRILAVGWSRIAALALAMTAAACGGDPVAIEFEVIEETTFAASLGVDLGVMQELASGVFLEDLVVGTGEAVTLGSTVTVSFTGWLTNGTQFDSGQFGFLTGNDEVISGFEDGVLGMRVGGTRLVVIPPSRGYGSSARGAIPPGSVLVFEITADALN